MQTRKPTTYSVIAIFHGSLASSIALSAAGTPRWPLSNLRSKQVQCKYNVNYVVTWEDIESCQQQNEQMLQEKETKMTHAGTISYTGVRSRNSFPLNNQCVAS